VSRPIARSGVRSSIRGSLAVREASASRPSSSPGAIAPGLELGLEALAARTAKLPRIELRTPDRAIGRDTVSAIQSGAILGHQALTSGLLARVRAELAEQAGVAPGAVRVILTGGLSAAPWARAVEGVDVIDPDLTLKGLAILHAEVAGGEPLHGTRA
jgi:type III pantothenate kinase